MSRRILVKAAEGHEYMNEHAALAHPGDGPLRAEGSWWTEDAYTFRLIKDGSIVQVEDTEPMESPTIGPEALVY